jgi:hypothetical protein
MLIEVGFERTELVERKAETSKRPNTQNAASFLTPNLE